VRLPFLWCPYVGEDLVQWIRGDFLISEITLNRFFALHVVAIPIVILALVVLHILALHEVGSNNPDGIDIKKNKDENGVPVDGIPFHPYYSVHDLVGISAFLIAFVSVIFYFPEMGGYFLEYANFEQANNLKTPEHIAPVWYFTPYYAILRAVTIDLGGVFTAKLLGFIAMGAAIVVLFFLPWLDKSPVRSIRYKGWLPKIMLLLFAAIFVILGFLGVKSPTESRTVLSQIGTLFYFVFFITMPIWSNPENPKVKSALNWVICVVLGLGLAKLSFSLLDKDISIVVRLFGLGGLVFAGLFFFIVMAVVPIKAVAAGAGGCGSIPCDEFKADLHDKESLQRGATWYTNCCIPTCVTSIKTTVARWVSTTVCSPTSVCLML